jgi:hypothetical protein
MTPSDCEMNQPAMPRKIGCRVCMSTARLTETLGGSSEVGDASTSKQSTLNYGLYRCVEGHVTHAAFDRADGSLRVYELENGTGDG